MKVLSYIILFGILFFILFINKKEKISDHSYKTIQSKELEESILRGSEIYSDFCVSCHLPNGKGVESTYPPLADSDYLNKYRNASISGIKYGLKGEIIVNGNNYNSYMPSMGLDDNEIADVMNYINHNWGNSYGDIVTEEEVRKIKE